MQTYGRKSAEGCRILRPRSQVTFDRASEGGPKVSDSLEMVNRQNGQAGFVKDMPLVHFVPPRGGLHLPQRVSELEHKETA